MARLGQPRRRLVHQHLERRELPLGHVVRGGGLLLHREQGPCPGRDVGQEGMGAHHQRRSGPEQQRPQRRGLYVLDLVRGRGVLLHREQRPNPGGKIGRRLMESRPQPGRGAGHQRAQRCGVLLGQGVRGGGLLLRRWHGRDRHRDHVRDQVGPLPKRRRTLGHQRPRRRLVPGPSPAPSPGPCVATGYYNNGSEDRGLSEIMAKDGWSLSPGAQVTTSTTTAMSTSAGPASVGQRVTYKATVTPPPDGGTVDFIDDGAAVAGCDSIAVSAANGQATCSVTYWTGGQHVDRGCLLGRQRFQPLGFRALRRDCPPTTHRLLAGHPDRSRLRGRCRPVPGWHQDHGVDRPCGRCSRYARQGRVTGWSPPAGR